jgi:uncharacterized protein (DUF433 family)/DNA-binding transcriptional MerR regulator
MMSPSGAELCKEQGKASTALTLTRTLGPSTRTIMGTVTRMPPRGAYLALGAGQLAGVSGNKIGQWARRGYIHSSVSEGPPRVYSFQDVAEAMVVHELVERGVRHRAIRKMIERVGDAYGDWPLTEAPLATLSRHGRTRLVLDPDDPAPYDIGEQGWQQVLDAANLERIRDQLHRGGWAVRNLPDLEYIEVNPDRLGGRPTIRGHRIAAEDVVRLADEIGLDELWAGYEISRGEVADARRWWTEVNRLAA